ncbi:MAG: hypothetical protein Q7T87_12185 [Polaromonas sp.]|nr:hypothetical protein [Polaromonas sp.]
MPAIAPSTSSVSPMATPPDSPSAAPASGPDAQPHLVIPFAACLGDEWQQVMKQLPPARLQNLASLLKGMKLVSTNSGDAMSLSPPHERVLAAVGGLPVADGLIPWAALRAGELGLASAGQAWSFVTPCHWDVGRESATLVDPAALALTEAESRTLLAAMQSYFDSDGIRLHYLSPTQWLAEGDWLRDLPTASLDRVIGRAADPWLPGAAASAGAADINITGAPPREAAGGARGAHTPAPKSAAATLRRLQNEMQMLLYTHPLNDDRSARRQWPVNSIWFSGTGTLAAPAAPPANLQVSRSLADAALAGNWRAYADAWTALDAGALAALLAQQRAGRSVRITLCGERSALTYESASPGLAARLLGLFKSPQVLPVLEQL